MTGARVLWLSHFVPYPPKGGAFQRSYHLLRALAEGNEVHLLAVRHKTHTHPPEELARAGDELRRFCRSVGIHDLTAQTAGVGVYVRSLASLASRSPATAELYRSATLRAAVRGAVASTRFDVVHVDTIGLAPYLEATGGVPAVLNHHNVESFMVLRRVEREPSPLRRAFYRLEGRKLERLERDWVPRFRTNLVVSETDAELLRRIVPEGSIDVVENGVDTDYFRPDRQEAPAPRLIFAGRLDQYANVDAMRFFIERIWPALRDRHAELKVEIVGNNPPPWLVDRCRRDDRVEVPGYVDDIRPRFRSAWAVVCPMREGAGTRLKVLDAMAMGVPLVATSMACEGIDVTPGKDVLVADTPERFVDAVERLLGDSVLRRSLGSEARRTVERRYAWTTIGAKLRETYARCLS